MSTLQQRARQQRVDRAIKHRKQMTRASDKATDKLITTKNAIAYGYGRVSHDCQVDGESVDAQGDRVKKFYEFNLASQNIEWGGFFQEPGSVSASKNDFSDRPTGKTLVRLLRPGDHLIIDKVDRLWRSLQDFARLMVWFKNHQINVHFASMSGCSVSTNTAMGDFVLGVFVLIAELEANTISERTKRALEYGMQQGYYKYPNPPFGCILLGKKPKRTIEYDWGQRADMSRIVEFRDEDKLSFDMIEKAMNNLYCQRSGRPFDVTAPWTRVSVRKAYIFEKMWRLHEDPIHADLKLLRCLNADDAATLNSVEDLMRLDEKYKNHKRRK